jgi:hypothetical protein
MSLCFASALFIVQEVVAASSRPAMPSTKAIKKISEKIGLCIVLGDDLTRSSEGVNTEEYVTAFSSRTKIPRTPVNETQ